MQVYRTKIPLRKETANKQFVLEQLSQIGLEKLGKLTDPQKIELKQLPKYFTGQNQMFNLPDEETTRIFFDILLPGKGKSSGTFDTDDIAVNIQRSEKYDEERYAIITEFALFDLKNSTLYSTVNIMQKKINDISVKTINDVNFEVNAMPIIAKWFVDHRRCGDVGGFKISNWPIRLRYEDGFNVKNIIERNTSIDLPVIISRIPPSIYDASRLYKKAIGQFIVLTEDDPSMFEWLKENKKENTYILDENELAIYYPFIKEPEYFSLDEYNCKNEELNIADISKELESDILCSITKYWMSDLKYETKMTTFDKIFIEYTSNYIEKIRSENKDLQSQLLQTTAELSNARKLAKNSPASAYTSRTIEKNLSSVGSEAKSKLNLNLKEKDLYPNEIREIVLDSLKEYREKYVIADSRRADILDSILKSNYAEGIPAKKAKEFEEVMKLDYQSTSPKFIKELEKLGFKVKSRSSHIKLLWKGDERYQFAISSTPSDYNSAANNMKMLIRKCL